MASCTPAAAPPAGWPSRSDPTSSRTSASAWRTQVTSKPKQGKQEVQYEGTVPITNETAAFAVASIRSWWEQLGLVRYPGAKRLTITADCGGANGNRRKL